MIQKCCESLARDKPTASHCPATSHSSRHLNRSSTVAAPKNLDPSDAPTTAGAFWSYSISGSTGPPSSFSHSSSHLAAFHRLPTDIASLLHHLSCTDRASSYSRILVGQHKQNIYSHFQYPYNHITAQAEWLPHHLRTCLCRRGFWPSRRPSSVRVPWHCPETMADIQEGIANTLFLQSDGSPGTYIYTPTLNCNFEAGGRVGPRGRGFDRPEVGIHDAQSTALTGFYSHLVLLVSILRYSLSWIRFNYYSKTAQTCYRLSFVAAAVTYGIVIYKTFRARQKVGAKSPGGALGLLADENVQYFGRLCSLLVA